MNCVTPGPRRVVVLGSTGSIGENALRVIAALPDALRLVGLGAGSNASRVAEQAREFGVRSVAMADECAAAELRASFPDDAVSVMSGVDGLCRLAAETDADVVLCAISGMAALRPALAAIEAGRDLAVATKEIFVAAGALVTRSARERGVRILPVDSEHSAIFQALHGAGIVPACVRAAAANAGDALVEKLWLTASGGPFFFHPEIDFRSVTPEMALAHPRWKMGPKVTVDSATMMNKGLETLEAHWLFGIPPDRIGVLVHPESAVHSLVELRDGTQLAQLGAPDMRIPIQHALTWPARLPNAALPRLDLAAVGALHFESPDESRFPCLRLAREAAAAGGLVPCAMNAANEAAVAGFLAGRLAFSAIPETVERAMENAPRAPAVPDLREILQCDADARAAVSARLSRA